MTPKPTFEKFYNQYRIPLIAYIIGRFNRSQEVAEELANDILMKAYKNFDREKGGFNPLKGKLFQWLCSVGFQVVTDYIRTDKRKYFVNINDYTETVEKHFFIERVATNAASDNLENEETMSTIKSAFKNLSENNRIVAIMRFQCDYGYNEIAEILDIPLNRVCQTVSRCKKLLRDELQPMRECA